MAPTCSPDDLILLLFSSDSSRCLDPENEENSKGKAFSPMCLSSSVISVCFAGTLSGLEGSKNDNRENLHVIYYVRYERNINKLKNTVYNI